MGFFEKLKEEKSIEKSSELDRILSALDVLKGAFTSAAGVGSRVGGINERGGVSGDPGATSQAVGEGAFRRSECTDCDSLEEGKNCSHHANMEKSVDWAMRRTVEGIKRPSVVEKASASTELSRMSNAQDDASGKRMEEYREQQKEIDRCGDNSRTSRFGY